MSVEASEELRVFHEFLNRRIIAGEKNLTPEQSVREFRVYQEELARFVRDAEAAEQQSLRGEAQPLNVEAVMSLQASNLI